LHRAELREFVEALGKKPFIKGEQRENHAYTKKRNLENGSLEGIPWRKLFAEWVVSDNRKTLVKPREKSPQKKKRICWKRF